jgi:hypothetical protein
MYVFFFTAFIVAYQLQNIYLYLLYWRYGNVICDILKKKVNSLREVKKKIHKKIDDRNDTTNNCSILPEYLYH